MARKIRRKTTRKTAKQQIRTFIKTVPQPEVKKSFWSRFKFTESYTSLIFGAIAIIIIGILFVTFAKISRDMQTSSTSTTATSQDSNTSSTYTVRPGDDLWTIAQNTYNDGYKWVEIAKLNKIDRPEELEVGDKLSLPKAEQQENIVAKNDTQNPTEISNTAAITGNSYTVVRGDCLWNIAVRAYGDGFKWVDIARANHLVNPDLIHAGNQFIIPR
jgi:nucleoid-associated protein YgaU